MYYTLNSLLQAISAYQGHRRWPMAIYVLQRNFPGSLLATACSCPLVYTDPNLSIMALLISDLSWIYSSFINMGQPSIHALFLTLARPQALTDNTVDAVMTADDLLLLDIYKKPSPGEYFMQRSLYSRSLSSLSLPCEPPHHTTPFKCGLYLSCCGLLCLQLVLWLLAPRCRMGRSEMSTTSGKAIPPVLT